MKQRIFRVITVLLVIFITLVPVSVLAKENGAIKDVEPADPAWIAEVVNSANRKELAGDFKISTNSRSAIGEWSWRDGIICITDSYASVPFVSNGHAGLVAVAPYYNATVEANPGAGNGVQIVYGSWAVRFSEKNVWQVGVTNTTVAQDQAAAQWAVNQLAKPYAFWISLSERNSFYCSHLVYAAYLDTCGVNLDAGGNVPGWVSPFEILNSSQVTLMYRNR